MPRDAWARSWGVGRRWTAADARTAAALIAACVGLWLAFLALAHGLGGAPTRHLVHLMMPTTVAWSPATAGAVFAMWAVMMAAMMLPSAIPMASTFAALDRARGAGRHRTAGFVLAYLLVWAAFSAAATALQWALFGLGLVSAAGASTTPWFAAGLLVAAGAVQFTELKQACLKKCRTPVGFLLTEWRAGARGAAVMGLRHGAFCVGCCWALMLLPFVAGTMNVLWMAVLTAVVTVEKLAPGGDRLARAIGLVLVATGMVLPWLGA